MEARISNPLNFEGNLAENFRKFKQAFEIYMRAADKNEKSDDVKVAILLNIMGEEGVEIFNNLKLTEAEKKNYEKVMQQFELYMNPKKNIIYGSFKFYSKDQQKNENFDHFLLELKTLSKTCEFAEPEGMVRDRIVLGINDKQLQEKLLTFEELPLDKCVNLCRSHEITKSQVKILQEGAKEISIDAVKKRFGQKNDAKEMEKEEYWCRRCRRKHEFKKCPAYGKQCENCGELNHFKIACRVNGAKTEEVQVVQDEVGEFFVGSSEEWTVNVEIGDMKIDFKIDTGAEVSILKKEDFKKVAYKTPQLKQKLQRTEIVLEAYGGAKIKPIGSIMLECSVGKQKCNVQFLIVDSKSKSVLGLRECKALNLVRMVNSIQNVYSNINDSVNVNNDIFKGFGKFKDQLHITLKQEAVLVVNPPRRISLGIRSRLKTLLEEMENKQIITKVNEPLQWVRNLVIIEKPNGTLRLCLDPQHLNKAIEKEHYLIPTLKDIAVQLKGKQIYTVLDLKDGFYYVELDEHSSKLCAFSNPFGTFKFNRLPFDLILAPEYFQKINEQNFSGIEGVKIYIDDLIIAANSESEHDTILTEVFNRARLFNKEKIQFKQTSVKYKDYVFDKESIRPDDNKVRAIKELEPPKNRAELQTICGHFCPMLRN